MERSVLIQETQIETEQLTQPFVFYGATRFEAPTVGLTFRREAAIYRILAIRQTNRMRTVEFNRGWRFTVECTRVA